MSALHVSFLVLQIRPIYERESGKNVAIFKPIMFSTQVVAGTNYYIKVSILDLTFAKCMAGMFWPTLYNY